MYFLCNHGGYTIHVNIGFCHRVSQTVATPATSVNRRRCLGCHTRERALVWWRAGHRAGSDRQADATVQEKTR